MGSLIDQSRFVAVLLIVIGLVLSGTVVAAVSTSSSEGYIFTAPLKPDEFLPMHHSVEAQNSFGNLLGNADGLGAPVINVTLPRQPRSLDGVKIAFTGKATASVAIMPSMSSLHTVDYHGQPLVHGFLTGLLSNGEQQGITVTVGVAALPEEHKAHFTVTVDGHDGVGVLTLAFGTLDPTPELVRVVTGR